jgi:transposase
MCVVWAQRIVSFVSILNLLARRAGGMALIQGNVHPNSLNFTNQRKCVVLRDVKEMTFVDIAKEVVTIAGRHPTPRTVANTYNSFNKRLGHRKFRYEKCGRKPWKLDKPTLDFLKKRLLELRKTELCTTSTLQIVLAREKGVAAHVSTLQKALNKLGYKWLPRAQKRKYTAEDMETRLGFAKAVLRLTNKEVREKMAMSMDGVVITIPPTDPFGRMNFCKAGETHMWRKKSEAALPELAGDDMYSKQAPIERCIPMWGGISSDGMAPILCHPTKKVCADDWAACVDNGKLKTALASLNPKNKHGPWTILCDNEGFLRAAESRRAHAAAKVSLWKLPPRSPDLNPVEKFWSWLRRKLRAMDLKDAAAKRPVPGKMAYRARLLNVCKSAAAKAAAAGCANSFRKTCLEVRNKNGAASRG